MANNIYGRYYSNTYTTGSVTGGEDLIDKVLSDLSSTGIDKIIAQKVTLISSGSYNIDVNNLGVYSSLWQNPNGNYELSLNARNVAVNSIKVKETSASGIFLAIIF